MSLFGASRPGGIFGASAHPVYAALTFYRQNETQNSAGELVLSFVSTVSVAGFLIPAVRSLPRGLHGAVVEVNYSLVLQGNPDLQESDRTVLSGATLEVRSIERFGVQQAEIALAWVR